jgi:hypothetical protein
VSEPLIDEFDSEPACNVAATAEVVKPHGRLLTWGVAGALICGFLVINYLTPGQFKHGPNGQWIVAVLVGICIAEVNLIAVWASLAPGNIVIRGSWSLLLTMAMWYCLIMGNGEAEYAVYQYVKYRVSGIARGDAIFLIALLLIGVVVLQIPLWIAKKLFRWRLTRRPENTEASLLEDRQFHLQHLLIATLLISVALSPLRQVLPKTPDPFLLNGKMFVVLGAIIVCNLVVTIPCIWWAFLSTARLIWLMFAWLFYCAALTGIEFGCLYLLLGRPGPRWEDELLTFYLLNLSQCAAVLGTLLILRAIGFRMVRMPAAQNR